MTGLPSLEYVHVQVLGSRHVRRRGRLHGEWLAQVICVGLGCAVLCCAVLAAWPGLAAAAAGAAPELINCGLQMADWETWTFVEKRGTG